MSLVSEIRNPGSPVTTWLRTTLPNHRTIQRTYRQAAGPLRAPTPAGGTPGTVGAAIDLWIRLLTDPAPDLHIAYLGATTAHGAPYGAAGFALLDHLGALAPDPHGRHPGDPTRWAGRGPEWTARCCYALALLVEPLRAGPLPHSLLHTLPDSAGVDDLLALAPPAAVTDLIALRDLATEHLLPALAGARVTTGPTFAGSRAIGGADADLIADGLLLDLKAAQGTRRSDGSRALALDRTDLDQLLGYALLDSTDEYRIDRVGLYAVRYGQLTTWPLADLLTELAGRPIRLTALRRDFATLLNGGLGVSRTPR